MSRYFFTKTKQGRKDVYRNLQITPIYANHETLYHWPVHIRRNHLFCDILRMEPKRRKK